MNDSVSLSRGLGSQSVGLAGKHVARGGQAQGHEKARRRSSGCQSEGLSRALGGSVSASSGIQFATKPKKPGKLGKLGKKASSSRGLGSMSIGTGSKCVSSGKRRGGADELQKRRRGEAEFHIEREKLPRVGPAALRDKQLKHQVTRAMQRPSSGGASVALGSMAAGQKVHGAKVDNCGKLRE